MNKKVFLVISLLIILSIILSYFLYNAYQSKGHMSYPIQRINSIEDIKELVASKPNIEVHLIAVEGDYIYRRPQDKYFDTIIEISDKKPSIILLSSKHSKNWIIKKAEGAKILKVLISSPKEQKIEGIDEKLILNYSGDNYRNYNFGYFINSQDYLLDIIDFCKKTISKKPNTIQSAKKGVYFNIDGKNNLTLLEADLDNKDIAFIKEKYIFTLNRSLVKGKWYFEAKIIKNSETDKLFNNFNIGIRSSLARSLYPPAKQGRQNGYAYSLLNRKNQIIDSKEIKDGDIISMALNLDQGKLFFAINGKWLNGNPVTSIGGIDIKKAREYYPVLICGNKYFYKEKKYLSDNFEVNVDNATFKYKIPNEYKSLNKTKPSKHEDLKPPVSTSFDEAFLKSVQTQKPYKRAQRSKIFMKYLDLYKKANLKQEKKQTHFLVLNLKKDTKIYVHPVNKSSTFFDIKGNGKAKHVSWIYPQMGFLVYDKNENGNIDNITEIFGSKDKTGFEELSALDINKDRKINSKDKLFSKLQIWQDFNFNGKVDEKELLTLNEHNIESINLAPITKINNKFDGYEVFSIAAYNNDRQSLVADLILETDSFESLHRGKYDSSAIGDLPILKGWGDVIDTHYAYSEIPGLKEYAAKLIDTNSNKIIYQNFDTFLAIWTGLSKIHQKYGIDRKRHYLDIDKAWMMETFIGESAVKSLIEKAYSENKTDIKWPINVKELGLIYLYMKDQYYAEFMIQSKYKSYGVGFRVFDGIEYTVSWGNFVTYNNGLEKSLNDYLSSLKDTAKQQEFREFLEKARYVVSIPDNLLPPDKK
jgi:hypothetical protein